MEQERSERPLITRLRTRNFRSLDNLQLELDPLTILVGPNASGKSNIVDVLRFVADALANDLDTAIAKRHGMTFVRRWSSKGRPYDVEIRLWMDHPQFSIEYGFTIGSKAYGQFSVKREYGLANAPQRPPLEFEVKDGRPVKLSSDPAQTPRQQPLFGTLPMEFESTDLALPALRTELRWRVPVRRNRETVSPILRPFTTLRTHLVRMRFYPVFPDDLREPQKPGLPYPLGEHGENLGSVLREMRREDARFFPDLIETLGKAVPGVSDILVTQVGGYFVVKLKHLVGQGDGDGAWFELFQESDGTLRLLALLVAIFQEPPPSLVVIEEPELFIHPGALAVLADVLTEAAQRTQVILTTHSPELIDRFPVDNLRAVGSVRGLTVVGRVAEHQRQAVREGLFTAGELHRIEGLQPAVLRK